MLCASRTRGLGAGLSLALLAFGPLQAEIYTIDPVHSSIEFSVRHLVSRSKGEFSDFSGSITYEPSRPESISVEAVIQVRSIDTGNDQRDKHLRSEDFFDVEKFPTIRFKSTRARKKDDKLMVGGHLTLHGVTREIVLPVEILGVGNNPLKKVPVAGFAAELTLKRSEYGVDNWTDKAGVLGDEIKIMLLIEANALGE